MRPNFGKIVSLDNKSAVEIDDCNRYDYRYTGSTVVANNGVRCATFKNEKNGEMYLQPWAIAGAFKRQGEANLGAVLKTHQVREMVRAFYIDKTPVETLAEKNNITTRHAKKIVSGNSWRHITQNYIKQLATDPNIAATCNIIQNIPKKTAKLSPALIPFVRKDKLVFKLSTKEIAKKYCISERHVRRITTTNIARRAWKNV